MTEILSEDWRWIKQHPKTVAFIVTIVTVFGLLLANGVMETAAVYERMAGSPHTELDSSSKSVGSDGTKREVNKRGETYIRYDASQDGVILPISREERLAADDRPSNQKGSEHQADDHRPTCQSEPIDTGYSDLCAQWASVAVARYTNRIGAENYRVSSFAALISALAAVATVLAVAVAAVAARDASKAVRLMKEGMLPFLSVRFSERGGNGKLKLINAGTGVATDIEITIGTVSLPLRRRVLQAGEEIVVTNQAIAPSDGQMIVVMRYKHASGQSDCRTERFCVVNGIWVQTA